MEEVSLVPLFLPLGLHALACIQVTTPTPTADSGIDREHFIDSDSVG
jgi:hypothetical protein